MPAASDHALHETGLRPARDNRSPVGSSGPPQGLVRPRHHSGTLEDPLEASQVRRHRRRGHGVFSGWFIENSHGWRTPTRWRSAGWRGKYWVLVEYGTHNWLTGGTGCFEGTQYQKTPTKPFPADGTVHEWALRYLPRAASGRGEVRFVLDGKEYVCPLAPGHKADGATFNRFGVFNHQTSGKGMEVRFSELVLQGKPLEQGAQWEGKGNHVRSRNACSGHSMISVCPAGQRAGPKGPNWRNHLA